jgi:hypothetical protein
MKQYITVADLQKLNNDEQIQIATLFGQYGNCSNTGGESMNLGKLSERITIGKMMELLWENKVPLTYTLVFNGTDERTHHFEDLCDELWKEIKNILMEVK